MKGLRIIAALLCAVMLAVPAMADDWDFGITEPDDHPTVETPAAPEPPAQETVSDPAASDPEPPAGPERDDNLWGDWKDPGNSGVRTELPSEEQQELVLPQREARTGSPVRYILIGALLAGALCIAIYLFTHPAREDDPADETKP